MQFAFCTFSFRGNAVLADSRAVSASVLPPGRAQRFVVDQMAVPMPQNLTHPERPVQKEVLNCMNPGRSSEIRMDIPLLITSSVKSGCKLLFFKFLPSFFQKAGS
jgi:hypothetical protein